MSFSEWRGVDLHIHSKKSNIVKGQNDFVGEEYSAEDLLDVLSQYGISIFSITDHNCFNKQLYSEIQSLLEADRYKNKMSAILGVELDVFDQSICQEVFHCLCFVETTDIEIVEATINSIFNNIPENERNRVDVYPDVSKIVKTLASKQIHDFLLIPHFNNKDKGIPQDIAVEHLNYLCFNAYEDSNNISGITKSLDIYLKAGFDNFPFAVFSDCHNLDVYPKMKTLEEPRNPTKCFMLSDLKYPFNSVKTAFEEPRMRISIESVTNMRKKHYNNLYLNEIVNDGKVIELSPYQNTIIGKFGSGKSLLMEKIKKGNSSLEHNERYSDFYRNNESFKIKIGESVFDSLEEALVTNDRIVNYDFLQQENYYFKNILDYNDVKGLFDRLNISFDFNNNFTKLDIVDNISPDLLDTLTQFENTLIVNNFNYERAFSEEQYFTFSLSHDDLSEYNKLNPIKESKIALEEIKEISIYNVKIFSVQEIETIINLEEIISSKLTVLNRIKDSNFESKMLETLRGYKTQLIDNNSKESKDKLLVDYTTFINSIKRTYNSILVFESKFNEEIFNELFIEKTQSVNEKLEIRYSYKNTDGVSFESLQKRLFSNDEVKCTFFQSWISAAYKKNKLRQQKNLSEVAQSLSAYLNKYNSICSINNTVYDLTYEGSSMLKKSAGEKSSRFIEVVFELIEKDLENEMNVILTLDQPEDNIDNDNTYVLIANKIKELKLKYNRFQIIVVTHNANVGIAADSENIIIATETIHGESKHFGYNNGSIENRNHINEVCNVLEGGINALRKRSIKYGVNIIRKVEQYEV
ncbi:hypothetical protein NBX27_06415 [Erysipelothrix rhusiopathiae]|uniref:hypothetical protein n=1 Tax=Erysipelothrix rhusiopathiae TaxID=1648 RepID=UPI00202B5A11|nr:hypothetical protein [Erysipelothrix rhusiopathiae]URQ76884.1 hypothetical protein NBX27_06415 [Erysipelothrix rhusiopathiae]